MKKSFLLLLLLTIASFDSLYCQPLKWKVVVPTLLRKVNTSMSGAIKAKNGTILAGWKNLILSTDYGNTWQVIPSPFFVSDYVVNLDVFDAQNFVIMTSYGEVYRTTDGGQQWANIASFLASSFGVAYLGSPNKIIMLSAGLMAGANRVMTIGGSTTSFNIPSGYGLSLAVAADGGTRILASSSATAARFYIGNDSSSTWTTSTSATSQLPLGDIYTVIADRSDPNRFVLINENWIGRTGGNSNILLTTNNGATWTTTYTQPLGQVTDLCGNGAAGCNDYFTGSLSRGILRSRDKGLTWNSIGGPPTFIDSKGLTAVDDSLIFAIDTNGAIWSTDPVSLQIGTPTITGNNFFNQLQIAACDSPVIGTLHFSPPECGSVDITSLKVIGVDSSAYSIVSSLATPAAFPDSIRIKFTPGTGGNKNAQVRITFSDGRTMDVPLTTFVNMPPTITFSQNMLNAFTDTIGGDVQLAIPLPRTGFPADAEFTIHYDTTALVYHGAFDPSNLDHTTGHPNLRSARIRFNALNDSVLYARFSFYPVDSSCTRVTIDSLTPLSANCLAVLSNSLSAEICSPPDCGWRTLARFVRLGKMPQLTVTPNPSSGSFTIETSQSLGVITISVTDKLGATVATQTSELSESKAVKLNLESLPSGMYFLRVPGVLAAVPIVVEK